MNMNQEKTGALIRALRQRHHMTQLQLAEAVGVSDKAVSKWETGPGRAGHFSPPRTFGGTGRGYRRPSPGRSGGIPTLFLEIREEFLCLYW